MPTLTGPSTSASGQDSKRVAMTNPGTYPDGSIVPAMGDKYGRTVVSMGAPLDLVTDSGTPVVLTSAAETPILAANATGFVDLTAIVIGNNTAGTIVVNIKDSVGGTIRLTFVVSAGNTQGISLTRPRYQSVTNAQWTATVASGSGSTVYVWAQAELRV